METCKFLLKKRVQQVPDRPSIHEIPIHINATLLNGIELITFFIWLHIRDCRRFYQRTSFVKRDLLLS